MTDLHDAINRAIGALHAEADLADIDAQFPQTMTRRRAESRAARLRAEAARLSEMARQPAQAGG